MAARPSRANSHPIFLLLLSLLLLLLLLPLAAAAPTACGCCCCCSFACMLTLLQPALVEPHHQRLLVEVRGGLVGGAREAQGLRGQVGQGGGGWIRAEQVRTGRLGKDRQAEARTGKARQGRQAGGQAGGQVGGRAGRRASRQAGRQAGRRAGGRAGGVSWMVGYQATLTRKSPGTRGRRPRWLPRPSRCPRSCIGSPAHRRLGQADGRRGKRARLGVWDVWLTVRLRQAVLGGGEQARGLAASGLVACLLLPARAAASHPCECSSRRCRRRWRLQRGRRQRAHIS